MSRLTLTIFSLAAGATLLAQAQSLPTPASVRFSAAPTNILPPLPQAQSPVNFFRHLLAMSSAERTASLTNRPVEVRARILAKVREYQALGPDERELRLRATDLRWHLTPLLRVPVTERDRRLALVPDDLRGLVTTRLAQWDILPPPLQQEFLANDKVLHSFAHVEGTNQPAPTPEQQQIAEQFNRFFELTTAEKQQTLGTLSAAERAQMEKTLQSFEKLPPQQRIICVRNYAKFAGMTAAERAEFLKNAENWSQMSPRERQTWRDLVAHVPQWPPMPPATVPSILIPHNPAKIPRPNMATNFK